jgi:C-methyltransferase C-terminal domain
MTMHHCPACHATASTPFLDNDPQALATLGWPRSSDAARAMPRHAQSWVRCTLCGHVYNPSFDYRNVPYNEHPNLMFNQGSGWVSVLNELGLWMADQIPRGGIAVEIGYGDGSFMRTLATNRSDARLVGFDPDGSATNMPSNVKLHKALFEPATHLAELMPNLIYARHVLEHLEDPLAFLQEMGYQSIRTGVTPLAYFETPCIDNTLARRRTCDFFYEHASQFSSDSFRRMLTLSGGELVETGRRYGGEVIWGLVRFGAATEMRMRIAESEAFRSTAARAQSTVRHQLAEMDSRGLKVAVWGGTGKSAAFMQRYELDAIRFPLVVDSDQAKVGTYVPGTGQMIQSAQVLKTEPPDVVIIPPQWRARDIHAEMQREGISAPSVLIEDEGRLVELAELLLADTL